MWYLDPWFYVAAVGGIGTITTIVILIINNTKKSQTIEVKEKQLSNHLRF